VDVSGDDVGSAAPVRISIDDVPLDDHMQKREPVAESEETPGRRAHMDSPVNSDDRVRISMASLQSGIVSSVEMKDGDEDGILAPIRIAADDIAQCEPDARGHISQPDHLWKISPHRRAGATAAGGVRIPAAMLAANGVTGPRISIR
jgi:hypothetical protein